MNSINELTVQNLLDNNPYTSFFKMKNLPIKKSVEKKLRKMYEDSLEDSALKTYFDSSSKKRPHFLYQVYRDKDIHKKIILSEFFLAPKWDKKRVKKLVLNTFEVDKRYKLAQFYLPFGSKLASQLEELGAVVNGYHLLGEVKDALFYYKKHGRKTSWKISKMTKEDIDEVVDLEYLAQKNSLSTRCGDQPKSQFRKFYTYMLSHKKDFFIAYENGEIIGVIAQTINNLEVGHIMSIAVHPKHQKRGVSKDLYYEALKHWKKKKVLVFSGVSTTDEVLRFSKKLKRKSVYVYLDLNRDHI